MGNQSIYDGTLSADDFYIAAKLLCEQWKSANTTLPNWTWISCKRGCLRVLHDGFLSLENIYHIKSSKDLGTSQDLLFEEQPVDCATVVQVPSNVIHVYDFHIIYSFSYRAPVLYFHGRQSDGQPLDLDDIQKDLPEYSLKLVRESEWTFITVEEHPYLHRPWYMLHPCGTSEWMKLLLGGVLEGSPYAVNYLVSWLSVVGQAVGLRIPSGLTSICFKDDSSSSIGKGNQTWKLMMMKKKKKILRMNHSQEGNLTSPTPNHNAHYPPLLVVSMRSCVRNFLISK